MAHELGLEVIAQGIETLEQESILRELECDYGQGHLIGRPMQANKLEMMLLVQSSMSLRDGGPVVGEAK